MTKTGKSLWNKVKGWLPGVLISLVAIYLVFKVANFNDLGTAFTAIKPIYILSGISMTVLFCLARAQASRTLLNGKPTYGQSFYAVNAGYLLNNLFPLRAGEIGRAILLGQTTGLGTFHVLSTIVIERVFDLAFAALLLLSSLPMALSLSESKPIAIGTLVAVVIGLIIMFLVAQNRQAVHSWVLRGPGKNKLVQKYILPYLDNLLEGLGALTKPKTFMAAVFWIAISWIVGILNYYVVVLSIKPDAPIWWGVLLDSVLAMGIALPSAPAALGVFEGMLVTALGLVGVDATFALAYAVVMHFIQFAVTGILGMIGLMKEGRSLGSIFKAAQSQKELSVTTSEEE